MRLGARLVVSAVLIAFPELAGAQAIRPRYLGCPLIRAMTNVDGAEFRAIRLSMSPPYLYVGRPNARETQPQGDCRAYLAADEADFDCSWDGPDDSDQLAFDGLRRELSNCLGIEMPPPSGPRPGDEIRALRRSETDIASRNGMTQVTLRLIEGSAGFLVGLDITYTRTVESVVDVQVPDEN